MVGKSISVRRAVVVAYARTAFKSMGAKSVVWITANTAGSSRSAGHVAAARFVCTISGSPCVEPVGHAASETPADCATAAKNAKRQKRKTNTRQGTSMAACEQVRVAIKSRRNQLRVRCRYVRSNMGAKALMLYVSQSSWPRRMCVNVY